MTQRPSFPARLDPSALRASVVSPRTAPATARPPPVHPASGFAAARRSMVRKLQADGLSDAAVVAALEVVERHRFVDSALHGQAYEDTSLPIGLGQTISKPCVVARMMELLRSGRADKLGRVLDIGTGCGYQAAVLGQLAREVYTIERLRALHERARENLRELRLANVHLLFGDGMQGFAKGAPYDGIVSAAGGESVPTAWTDQLALGGRLVAPTVRAGGALVEQVLVVVERTRSGLRHTVYEAVNFVPLKSGVA
ncbi:MAG: protein-L-isoaspartate(D-aspartate) O-methyltransferase [Rhodoferax sp.]|nr:protein-L-isoaspartate(D-aspartate) O-methyltransferase [Rhodoferax sp.]